MASVTCAGGSVFTRQIHQEVLCITAWVRPMLGGTKMSPDKTNAV